MSRSTQFLHANQANPCVGCVPVYDADATKPRKKSRMQRQLISWAGLVILALLVLTPSAALAKKLVISEAIEITGKIQRPQAMYILQRTPLNLKGMQLRRSLIPKLLESMRKPPL